MSSNSGVVAEEKLRPTTSMSGSALRAEKRVIVFPEPGGPQRTTTRRKKLMSKLISEKWKKGGMTCCKVNQNKKNEATELPIRNCPTSQVQEKKI